MIRAAISGFEEIQILLSHTCAQQPAPSQSPFEPFGNNGSSVHVSREFLGRNAMPAPVIFAGAFQPSNLDLSVTYPVLFSLGSIGCFEAKMHSFQCHVPNLVSRPDNNKVAFHTTSANRVETPYSSLKTGIFWNSFYVASLICPITRNPIELKFFFTYGPSSFQYTFGQNRRISDTCGWRSPHVRLRPYRL